MAEETVKPQFDPSLIEELSKGTPGVTAPDEISQVLNALVAEGELTFRQADDIENLMRYEPSLERAVAYASGEFGVAPKTIEKVTGSLPGVTKIDAKNVEEQRRTFIQQAQNYGTSLRNFMMWPTNAVGEAIQDVTGFRGFGTGESVFDNTGIAGAIRTDPTEAREKRDRARLRDQTRTLIDYLSTEGYITDSRAKKMKSVTDNYNAQTYADLSKELGDIFASNEELVATVDAQGQGWGAVLANLEARAKTLTDGEAQVTEEEAQPTAVPEEDGTLPRAQTFNDLLAQAGFLAQQQQATTPREADRATFDYLYVDGVKVNYTEGAGSGPSGFLDRATGGVLSIEQYRIIQANEALKQRYAELGREQGWVPSVQEMLDSGRFIDPKRRTVTRTGLGGIPLEGTVPSAVVSETWQRPLYDWNKGAGSAQWNGMAAYSRRAKLNFAAQNGLINAEDIPMYEAPSSLRGGELWEQVLGLSRDKQIDPYTAMKELGAEVQNIRYYDSLNATRGSRGSSRAPFVVPASLRTIPDYKALATETREVFRPKLGRDMEDWELSILADELGNQYKKRNDQLIAVQRAAYDDALSGGSVDVKDFEVTDPRSDLTFDIEEKYADELQRQKDVTEYAGNRQLLMDGITSGQRMI